MLGTYALSAGYYDAYYLKAQKARTLIKDDFDKAFEQVDVIATPTSPTTAFKIGERMDDPLQMYLADVYTISANLAGIGGISAPAGLDPAKQQLLEKVFLKASQDPWRSDRSTATVTIFRIAPPTTMANRTPLDSLYRRNG